METAIVIINTYEPEGEVASRLLVLAVELGHNPRDVEAQRGEHDAALAFRVPVEVAQAFDAERSDLWPHKIENDGETSDELPATKVTSTGRKAEKPKE
jgi:hypothetical protein